MPEAINKPALSLEEPPENHAADTIDGQSDAPHKIRAALLKTFFTGLSWTACARTDRSRHGGALRRVRAAAETF